MKNIQLAQQSYQIPDMMRAMKRDLYDDKENGIIQQVKILRSPQGTPILSVSKELNRLSAKNAIAEPSWYKPIPAIESASDKALSDRINDIVFPLEQEMLDMYGPLSDIPDRNMKIFMTEQTANQLHEHQVNIDVLDEELSKIESQPVNQAQHNLGLSTLKTRDQVSLVKRQMAHERDLILHKYPKLKRKSGREFVNWLASNGEGENVRRYIEYWQELRRLEQEINQHSAEIVVETARNIWLPRTLEDSLLLPGYNLPSNRYAYNQHSIGDLIDMANINRYEATQEQLAYDFDIDTEEILDGIDVED